MTMTKAMTMNLTGLNLICMEDHGYNIGHDFGRGVELNMHDVRLAANFLKATTHKLGDLKGREGEVPWD